MGLLDTTLAQTRLSPDEKYLLSKAKEACIGAFCDYKKNILSDGPDIEQNFPWASSRPDSKICFEIAPRVAGLLQKLYSWLNVDLIKLEDEKGKPSHRLCHEFLLISDKQNPSVSFLIDPTYKQFHGDAMGYPSYSKMPDVMVIKLRRSCEELDLLQALCQHKINEKYWHWWQEGLKKHLPRNETVSNSVNQKYNCRYS